MDAIIFLIIRILEWGPYFKSRKSLSKLDVYGAYQQQECHSNATKCTLESKKSRSNSFQPIGTSFDHQWMQILPQCYSHNYQFKNLTMIFSQLKKTSMGLIKNFCNIGSSRRHLWALLTS